MLTTEDLVAMTMYTAGKQNRWLEFTDTNELIVEWPNDQAPTTHVEAAAEALRITREMAHATRNAGRGIPENKPECSICRRRHGREIIHECE